MSGPDDLVATALLGTERRPSAADGWPGALGAAAAAVDGDPAAVLLSRAALATLWRRAGELPVPAAMPAPAPAEQRPAAPEAAARRLAGLLEDRETGLLDEWLATAAARGYVVPPALLPDLLDRGSRLAAVRPALRVVAGERGLWLARQRPEWAWLARLADEVAGAGQDGAGPPDLSDEAWRLGDQAARLRWVAAVRAADPARALAAVEQTWRSEPGPARAGLLAALAEGLGAADEPLLERALDDRRKDVRETAARLLAALPGSALGERMAARARAAVRLERGLLRTRLVVEVPDDLDAAAVRDGVVDPPANSPTTAGTGRRAGWLRQIVAAAPLSAWADLGPPDRAVATTVADGWAPVLHAGWAAAAGREGSLAWAEALLGAGVDLGDGLGADRVAALLGALPEGDRARVAALVVRHALGRLAAREVPADTPAVLAAALAGCPRSWPPALVDAVLEWLGAAAARLPLWPYQGLVDLLVHALPPGAAPRVGGLARPTTEDGARWANRLHRAATTLTTRAEMLEELR